MNNNCVLTATDLSTSHRNPKPSFRMLRSQPSHGPSSSLLAVEYIARLNKLRITFAGVYCRTLGFFNAVVFV